MRLSARATSGLLLAVVAAGMALSVHALRANGPQSAAPPATLTPACSSCDARHAHLRAAPGRAGEAQE